MKVLQFSFGSPGCIYYRNLNMGEVIKSHDGESLVIETDMGRLSDLIQAENYIRDFADIVVITRFNDWTPIINIAHEQGKPVVYELDDTPYLHSLHPVQQISVLNRWVERVATQATFSDACFASTEPLKRLLSQYNDNVFVLPNMLDYSLPVWNAKRTRNDSNVVLGYYGGSSHKPDIEFIQKPVLQLIKKFPDVRWWYGAFPNIAKLNHYDEKENKMEVTTKTGRDVVMAKQLRRMFSSVKRKKLKYLYPADIDKYGEIYADFDIGIVPLTNDDFNQYKSNLKLLEYGAYNVPVVAKRSEPYTDLIEESGGGILANTEAEFYDGLARLAGNKKLRQEMGMKLGKYVRKHFDLHTNGDVYLDAYAEVLKLTPSTEKAPGVPSKLGYNMINDVEESDEQTNESPEGHQNTDEVRLDD